MGLRGAATSRAEAQVLRLSAIYAALDSSSIIGLPHLQAAFAVWDYCSASASFLFGTSTGVPIADRIREALDSSPNGLSKNQISRLFHGHVNTDRIDAALEQLLALDAVNCHSEPTAGSPLSPSGPPSLSTKRKKRKQARLDRFNFLREHLMLTSLQPRTLENLPVTK